MSANFLIPCYPIRDYRRGTRRMNFFQSLENLAQMAQGMGNPQSSGSYQQTYPQPSSGNVSPQGNPSQLPDHPCHQCNIPMSYHGAHALRTGGLSKGFGLAADLFLGGGDEGFINTAMEKNVVLHVFVCGSCGRLEFINDPQRGF